MNVAQFSSFVFYEVSMSNNTTEACQCLPGGNSTCSMVPFFDGDNETQIVEIVEVTTVEVNVTIDIDIDISIFEQGEVNVTTEPIEAVTFYNTLIHLIE